MSSEGSVTSNGSRIRQFGLYRTIDSRTEDFLRSSRKRQIRQGCACAAISTAITVTVVVSVILVYENSITSGANVKKKTLLNPNWIALMNDSDIPSISFNKKINFDRTTLKLLPILLKALNKNRYLEKILEDYSSSPPYTGTDATEATFTRNVFSDSKKWLKLPTTRHYSTDHKTSPLMQWKTPTQRLEYLTKIRKIRDYQRMLNYVDKMINDKVGIYQKREFGDFTESPLIVETMPMTKIAKYKNFQRLRNLPPLSKNAKYDGGVCNCPKKLGLLVDKLIGSLKDLVPHIIGNKTKHIEGQLTTAQTVRPTKHRIRESNRDFFSTGAPIAPRAKKDGPKVTLQSIKCCSKSTTYKGTTTATKIITSTNVPTITSTATVETPETTTSLAQNELKYKIWKDYMIPIRTKKPQMLPNYQTYEKITTNYDLFTRPTETPSTQTTENVEIKRQTAEKIVPVQIITESYKSEPLYSKENVPLYKEDDYDEYFTINNELNKATKGFENIDVHSIESLKIKTKSSVGLGKKDKKMDFEGTTDDVKPMKTITMQPDLDLASMRKLADMLYLPQDKTTKAWKYTTEPDVSTTSYKKIKYPGTQKPSIVTNLVENSIDPTTSIISTNLVENSIDPTSSIFSINSVENSVNTPPTSIMLPSSRKNSQIGDSAPDVENYHHEAKFKYHPNSLIQNELQNIENIGDDELQEEFQEGGGGGVPYKYKKITKQNNVSIKITKQTAPLEFMKRKGENINKSSKSMLPALRPTYLEIQRNTEWKPEEHGDYDINNFNNNIFDLPIRI